MATCQHDQQPHREPDLRIVDTSSVAAVAHHGEPAVPRLLREPDLELDPAFVRGVDPATEAAEGAEIGNRVAVAERGIRRREGGAVCELASVRASSTAVEQTHWGSARQCRPRGQRASEAPLPTRHGSVPRLKHRSTARGALVVTAQTRTRWPRTRSISPSWTASLLELE